MAEDYFLYFPPTGAAPIQFGNGSAYVLRDFQGIGTALVNPQSQKAPYQIGETFINTNIKARSFSIDVRIRANSHIELNQKRNELSRALVLETNQTAIPNLGVLRYVRQDLETYEIEVSPVNSPEFSEVTPSILAADASMEFYAPYSYWRAISDSNITITNPEIGAYQLNEWTENDYETTGTNTNLLVYPNIKGF